MRQFLLVFFFLLLAAATATAQNKAREKSPVRGHILGFTTGYACQVPPNKQIWFSGVSYACRLGDIYSLFFTLIGGPAFAREYDRPFFESRLFIENKFNILVQKRVQPVLLFGGHIGTVEFIYLNGSEIEHKHKIVYGFNLGTGVEVNFAKHWMAGLYPRFYFTLGTQSGLDPSFHIQPMVSYRW